MIRLRSNNPYLRRVLNDSYVTADYEVATYGGVALKTLYFVALILIGAYGGLMLANTNPGLFQTLLIVSIFTSFIFAFISFIMPRAAKIFGSLYCLGQGMIVGVVSVLFNQIAQGAVAIALLSTLVVLIVVATLFLTRIVVVNSKFTRFLMVFAISMLITQLLMWVLSMFTGGGFVEWRFSFLISGLFIFLATLYLLFDFEMIRQVVEGRAPKHVEWFVSFGLVFTIVWLYMEILPVVARILLSRR